MQRVESTKYGQQTNNQVAVGLVFHCCRGRAFADHQPQQSFVAVAGGDRDSQCRVVCVNRAQFAQGPAHCARRPGFGNCGKTWRLGHYLSQIGTVTPFATVTVVSRVAGQILKIDFTEGQLVEPGQLLFNIDPRPYQAQLVQYEGQLARDTATLANARISFERYRLLLQQGVIARQDLDNQQAVDDQARGSVENDQGLN